MRHDGAARLRRLGLCGAARGWMGCRESRGGQLKACGDLGVRARYGKPASIPGGDRGVSVVCARCGGGDDQWVQAVSGRRRGRRSDERGPVAGGWWARWLGLGRADWAGAAERARLAGLSASGPGREGGWAAEKPAGPARWAHAGERKGPTGPREKDGLDWAWGLGVLGWIS